MTGIINKEQIMRTFLDCILQLQNVQRGSIWVKREDGYHCIEALGNQSERVKGIIIDKAQQCIVGWVIENGEMKISEAGHDPFHFKQIEEGMMLKSNIILSYPLLLHTGEVYGAIEIIDTSSTGDIMNLDRDYLALIENIITVGSIALTNYMAYSEQLESNVNLQKLIQEMREQEIIIGESPAFRAVLKQMENLARSDYPVLITGESGTGKELIAREIHRYSKRKDRPYLVQNCSAIPETLLESELFGHKKGAFTDAKSDKTGLFEAADGGTLFLDEIGDMPVKLQARILRVLQNGEIKPVGSTVSKKVDVRIISATNVDLTEAITKKEFRKDLFYRLMVLPFHVPSLKERKEDIPILLESFIRRESKKLSVKPKKIAPETLRYLVNYPWPGNVRELENFVKQILVFTEGKTITPDALPVHFTHGHPPETRETKPESTPVSHGPVNDKTQLFEGYTWEQLEKEYVYFLLNKFKWNITKSAQYAGLNRSTFDSRVKKFGINKQV